MPPRAGADPGGGAAALAAPAPSRLLLPLLLVTLITAALMPGAAGYADTPQVDAAALPPNSFVNLSNPAQLAAYAQSQGLPPDANTTRPCSCECLPTWSHMILPDYNNRLVAVNNYTALIVKEHACAADDWPVPWCYVNTTTCPDAVSCVNAIAPWAPCATAGDMQTLPDISNHDCSIGGLTTASAVPDDAVTEDAYAEHPLGCECKASWTYAGETWHGCANPGNNWPSAWCYVNTTTCLPGAWACAIEQGLWGQCDSVGATRTSNTSSLHMCQTQGPGLHGIERIEPASSSTGRNPAIVIGAVCGLLGGLLLLATGLLAIMARRRSNAASLKLAADSQAEKGNMDKALQLSRGWSSSTAGSSSTLVDGAACVARTSALQVQGAPACSSWPGAVPGAGLDAAPAESVLSMGRPASTWPLARVSEHDCAALVADLVRCGEGGEPGGEEAWQQQQPNNAAGSGLGAAMALGSYERHVAVSNPLLDGGRGTSTAGSAIVSGGSRAHGLGSPAASTAQEAAESRWVPHTGRPGLWLKADVAPQLVRRPDGGMLPSSALGLLPSPEAESHGLQLAAAPCPPQVPPPDPGAWPAQDLSSYGGAVAGDRSVPQAPARSGFGIDAATGEQPLVPPVPPPPAECPGNPFAVVRDQHTDNADAFPTVASVRRRTPTPLLSTLRPDYKAGREHPLLRW